MPVLRCANEIPGKKYGVIITVNCNGPLGLSGAFCRAGV